MISLKENINRRKLILPDLLIAFFNKPLALGAISFPFTPLHLLLAFVLPLVCAFVIYRLLLRGGRKLLFTLKIQDEMKEKIGHWYRLILRLIYLFLIIGLISRLFGAKLFEYWRLFYSALNQPLIKSGDTSISFVTIILTIPVFYLASWAGRISKGMMNQSFLRRIGIDEAKQFSLANLLRYSVMFIVLLIGLSVIGINLSALTVIFGVLGLGLGFGLQNVVANFFAGVVIIITRPIKEGDFIIVEGNEGSVVQIRIISTVISTLMNETIIVPNSQLVSNTVYNNTYDDKSVLIRNDIGVSYRSDVERVVEMLESATIPCPFRRKDKAPAVRLKEFGSSSINFAVFTWIRDVHDKYAAHHWINMEIWKACKTKGIEIPFPQLDLHLKDEDNDLPSHRQS